MVLPRVCLSPGHVKACLILSMLSARMKQRVFLVYTKPFTMRIGEAVFEQLANVISFPAVDALFPRRIIFSDMGRCLLNRYLWRKIEIDMLYFSSNSLLALYPINV